MRLEHVAQVAAVGALNAVNVLADVSIPGGMDVTSMTNLGATAIVSFLLVWVITKDRPAERAAFLSHLANESQANRNAIINESTASRTAIADVTAANREAVEKSRQDFLQELTRLHELYMADRTACREDRKGLPGCVALAKKEA